MPNFYDIHRRSYLANQQECSVLANNSEPLPGFHPLHLGIHFSSYNSGPLGSEYKPRSSTSCKGYRCIPEQCLYLLPLRGTCPNSRHLLCHQTAWDSLRRGTQI
ncbi:hypothetical protein AOLI_G00275900 [Acnodon oligacanthus]